MIWSETSNHTRDGMAIQELRWDASIFGVCEFGYLCTAWMERMDDSLYLVGRFLWSEILPAMLRLEQNLGSMEWTR
jgi:hypothetical protein